MAYKSLKKMACDLRKKIHLYDFLLCIKKSQNENIKIEKELFKLS